MFSFWRKPMKSVHPECRQCICYGTKWGRRTVGEKRGNLPACSLWGIDLPFETNTGRLLICAYFRSEERQYDGLPKDVAVSMKGDFLYSYISGHFFDRSCYVEIMHLIHGIEEESSKYIGQSLFVTPFYGWGWCRMDPGAPQLSYEESAGPKPFHLRLESLGKDGNSFRYGIGRIEEEGHEYNGFWAEFSVRHIGRFNFTDRVGAYNISIGPEKDAKGIQEHSFVLTGSPLLGGFAEIKAHERDKSVVICSQKS
jgi:hypothetical protein